MATGRSRPGDDARFAPARALEATGDPSHQANDRIDAARIEKRRRERPGVTPPRYPKPDVTVGTLLDELRAARRERAELRNTLPTVMVMQELPAPRGELLPHTARVAGHPATRRLRPASSSTRWPPGCSSRCRS